MSVQTSQQAILYCESKAAGETIVTIRNPDARVREYFENITLLSKNDRRLALEEAYAARNYLNLQQPTDPNNDSLTELLGIIRDLEGHAKPSVQGTLSSMIRMPWTWIVPSLVLALIICMIPFTWEETLVWGRNKQRVVNPGLRFIVFYGISTFIYLLSCMEDAKHFFGGRLKFGMRPATETEKRLAVAVVRVCTLLISYGACVFMIQRAL